MLIEISPHQYAILDWIRENKQGINTVLEIGVGRENYSTILKKSRLGNRFVAIEQSYKYIHKYALSNIYNVIFNTSATTLEFSRLGYYDITIISTILNHITLADCFKIIENSLKVAPITIVSIDTEKSKIPVSYVNTVWESNVKLAWEDRNVSNTTVFWLKSI